MLFVFADDILRWYPSSNLVEEHSASTDKRDIRVFCILVFQSGRAKS